MRVLTGPVSTTFELRMKKNGVIVLSMLALVCGCAQQDWSSMKGVTRVEVGTRSSANHTPSVIITNKTEITEFLAQVRFAGERDYTVKHPLPGRITLCSGPDQKSHAGFEDRILRWNQREWRLSRQTAARLKELIEGSNQSSEPIP